MGGICVKDRLDGKFKRERNNTCLCQCCQKSYAPSLCCEMKNHAQLSVLAAQDAPQVNAWICDGREWFENVFLKKCGEERPKLLIFYSHDSLRRSP